MSSIIRAGSTFHGISVFGRGVFTFSNDEDEYGGMRTYAGQIRDGYACGLGVVTRSDGTKFYAEHGLDGKYDGRNLGRWASGNTWYRLYERGKAKVYARVSADGDCQYNGEACAPDDPRLLALIAQVAPVEVRPAAPALRPPPARHSHPGNRPSDRLLRRSRRALPSRYIPMPHRWWLCHTTQQQPHCAALSPGLLAGLRSLDILFGSAGRGGRGQPATALGGARALRPPSSAGYSRGTQHALHGTHSHGVL